MYSGLSIDYLNCINFGFNSVAIEIQNSESEDVNGSK